MKVLMCHNYYQQPGGEDQSYEAEARLLESYGNQVVRYTKNNEVIQNQSLISIAIKTLWNQQVYNEIVDILKIEKPDVIHLQNIFPLISPSVYYAAKEMNIPVVQTLRNYRFICLNGLLFRDGRVCEDCIGRFPYPGIKHRCYRSSMIQSLVVASLRLIHYELLKTWITKVNAYIVSSEHTKEIFVRGGFDENKMYVKPNIINIPPGIELYEQEESDRNYIVFAGRLDDRKGIKTLMRAMEGIEYPLKIIGDGELKNYIQEWQKRNNNIELIGWVKKEELYRYLRNSIALILPSEFYESFGNVIVEAYYTSTPVIVSDIGAQASIVNNGITGLHFKCGEYTDLRSKIKWAILNKAALNKMGDNGKKEYESLYTKEYNYELLMKIYENALK